MSKEEFLKIQTCVLKVNIHCDGCKQKVKKILQKIDGVYTTNIDSEQGKVTVSGNVDPATLIKKLTKNGKPAEIWGALKANNNNQQQMNNQFKNLQNDSGSKGGQNKGQAPKGGGNNQPKGGLQAQNPQIQQQLPQNPQIQQQLQQLQQLQQSKGLQDLKMAPQFMKDLKGANNNKDQNQKSVKFNLPEDEGFSDDFDDDDFDYDDDDDFDDEVDDFPVVSNKMKPPVLLNGHVGGQMGNITMNHIMNGQHPQFMKGGVNNGGNGGGNGKKGGGGGGVSNMPVQMNPGGGNQNQGGTNGGRKGGNGNINGGNQSQGGGKGGKNGGGQPNDGKNGGGGQNKNGGAGGGGAGVVNGNNSVGNGAKKGGGMNDGPHGMMPNMLPVSAGGHMGPLGTNMPMGQMGNLPMGQMNNLAAVQGLPASAMTGGGGAGAGAGAGYFPAATPEHMMTASPYYQQQLAAMMMNQQRANGNERFQPMMYARPPPAVNYMPPYPPYPYLYAPPHSERTDQYAMFSDENTSSCNVM